MANNNKTTDAPKQPKDWARIKETAKTIVLTALIAAIAGFTAGIAYEKSNTASIKAEVQATQVTAIEQPSK